MLVIGLPQLVGVWFQVLLTPLIGVLFIVRSRYFPLSVVEEYLALEGGPPSFTRSSTSSMLLWKADGNAGLSLSHTGLSPSVAPISMSFC